MQKIFENLLYAGVDIGYGAAKGHLADENGYNSKSITPSTVATGHDRTFALVSTGGEDAYNKKLTPLENQLRYLDVEIENLETGESNWLFLGRLAVKEGTDTKYCWDDDKSRDMKSMALLIALLAAGQTSRVNGTNSYTKVYVSTGLPVKMYKTLKSSYEQNIKGSWKVTFRSGVWKGISTTLDIIGCRTYPQALGIFNDQVINLEGDITNVDLFNDYVLVIDPGTRTTDYALFKDGVMLDGYADSLEDGMSRVLENITAKLKELDETLVTKDYDLDMCFIENNGLLRKGLDEYDLIPIKNQELFLVADIINQKLKKRFSDIWGSISTTLIGGGTGKELYEYLNFPNKRLATDAAFGNATGFLKYAIEIVHQTKQKGMA